MSTHDCPEREFDVYDREGFPRVPLYDAEGEDISNPTSLTEDLKPKSCRTPRR